MAGASRYTALLDACVLYPAVTRDALMSLAKAGFYAPKWTRRIEEEWVQGLLRKRSDLEPDRLATTCDLMHQVAADWEIDDFDGLIAGLELPDANDRHVLAAAIRGHVDCIVSANRRDFPAEVLSTYGLELFHPDEFLLLQLDLKPVRALKAFKAMRARLDSPPLTPDEFVYRFEKVGLPSTAARLREGIELL